MAERKNTKKTDEQKAKIQAEAAKRQAEIARKKEIHDEIISVIIIAVGVFFAVSLHTSSTGAVGNVVQSVLFGLFGRVAYVFPYYMIVYGILNFAQKTSYITWRSVLFCSIFFFLVATMNAGFKIYTPLSSIDWAGVKALYLSGKSDAGVIGGVVYGFLARYLGKTGIYIVCITGMIICLVFIINTPISAMFDKIKIKAQARREATALAMAQAEAAGEQLKVEDIQREIDQKKKIDEIRSIEISKMPEESEVPEVPEMHLSRASEQISAAEEIEASDAEKKVAPNETMKLPIFNLFGKKDKPAEESSEETAEEAPVNSKPEYDMTDKKQRILSYVNNDEIIGKGDKLKTPGFGLDGTIPGEEKPENTVANTNEINLTPMEPMGLNAVQAKMIPEESYNSKKQGAKYKFPPISLLNKAKAGSKGDETDLDAQSQLLEDAMRSFGVQATVIDVVQGPSVTRFEVQPAPGVKVSSISKLHDDIMLHLCAKSLRIEAPIPGKAAVGIEVSNDKINMVSLREILESKEFTTAKSKISMGLGKNIAGKAVVANLKEMPHLLIAGSTGSGKSVCINSIIMSILYKATPDEVKLILIDPKVVELSVYNGIPHLLIPVVTEPNKAAAALGWAVTEMDERYRCFEKEGVRDLTNYNETLIANDEKDKVLPQIVIIIDEMADLMAAAQNQIETYINRLAAKARAAGIHLIFATQHPSVNVISGTIKSNFPSRIALAVSSMMDSRVILDEGGAENLIGKGDMLYSPQSLPKPLRVQGCFVSDEEIEKVIDFIKQNSGTAVYSETVNEALNKSGSSKDSGDDGEDDLYREAVEFVAGSDTASVSSLQRRFRIGYNRAARLIDDMAANGIVGPADGSHPRKVLITAADLNNAKAEKEKLDKEVDS